MSNKTSDIKKLLQKWHLLVLQRSPLKERLEVLHQLSRTAGSSNQWEQDVIEHERLRIIEIENEFNQLNNGDPNNETAIQELDEELKSFIENYEICKESEERRRLKLFNTLCDTLKRHYSPHGSFVWFDAPFENACKDWEEQCKNSTPPSELVAQVTPMLQFRDRLRIRRSRIIASLVCFFVMVFCLYVWHSIDASQKVYAALQRKNELIADFEDSVKNKNVTKADELYTILSKDHPESIKDSVVIENKEHLQQIKKNFEIYQQKFSAAETQCRQSIEKAENDPSGINASLLNRDSLEELTSLAKNSTVKSTEQTETVNFLTSRYALVQERSDARIAEVERVSRFQQYSKTVENSILSAMKDKDNYDINLLENEALKSAEKNSKLPEEKSIVAKLKLEFTRIENAAIKQQYDRLIQVADESIKSTEAVTENPDTTKLNDDIIEQAKKLLADNNEILRPFISTLDRVEKDFRRIREKAKEVERKTKFKELIDILADSIKKATKDEANYNPSFLDDESLKVARFLADNTETVEIIRIEQQFADIRKTAEQQESERTEREFDTIFKRAADSYKKASEFEGGLNETLLDSNALEIALKYIGKIPPQKELEIKTIQTDFEKLKRNAIIQRNERLLKFVSEKDKEFSNIQKDQTLSLTENTQRLDSLKTELKDEAARIKKEEQDGRLTERSAQDKASELYKKIDKELKNVLSRNVTFNIGTPDNFWDSLKKYIDYKFSNEKNDAKILSEKNQGILPKIQEVQKWNDFVTLYGKEINQDQLSHKTLLKVIDFTRKELNSAFFISESSVLRERLDYYLSCNTRWNKFHSYNDTILKLKDYSELPLVKNIKTDMEKFMEDSNVFSIEENWFFKIIEILKTIKTDQATDSIPRLLILKEIMFALVQEGFFSQTTSSWRSSYGSSGFDPKIKWQDADNPSLSSQRKIASLLINTYPVESMTESIKNDVKRVNKISLIPKPATKGKIDVEYVWIGWIDRNEENIPNLVIKINTDKLPAKVNDGDLYAVLPVRKSTLQPPSILMQKIGTLKAGHGVINANSQDMLLGTPIYLWQENN